MSCLKSIQQIFLSNYVSVVYAVGGFICLIWLLNTPPGLWGKAEAVGYAVCHRIDTRSFHIGIRQFPLCARCTGQYLGAVISLIYLSHLGKHRAGMPPKRVIVGMILLIILYAIDGFNSYFYLPPFLQLFPSMPHLYEPSNVLRLMTGTGVGLVIGMVLYPAFWGSILIEPNPLPAVGNLRTFFIILGLGIFIDLLILSGLNYILIPAALISTAGVVVLLSMVYTILLLRLIHKENQFTSLFQISRYMVIGFFITIMQIALFDLIRFIITGSWHGILF